MKTEQAFHLSEYQWHLGGLREIGLHVHHVHLAHNVHHAHHVHHVHHVHHAHLPTMSTMSTCIAKESSTPTTT